jgi:hypothetical protein
MSEELELCPFCGNPAHKDEIGNCYCLKIECGAHKADFTVKQWNNRPLEDALRAERDLLAKKLERVIHELHQMENNADSADAQWATEILAEIAALDGKRK